MAWKGSIIIIFKVWGCEAYVKIYTPNKLESRSTKCIFVGYPEDSMGYYFYNPNEHKVFIARKAKFLERKFLREGTNRTMELEEDREPQADTRLVDTSN